jgi:hypothetical protein
MTIQKIRELCHTEPFQPFDFHLPDGRHVPVEHPDFIALSPTGRTVVVLHADESQSLIDPVLVSDITLRKPRARRPKP